MSLASFRHTTAFHLPQFGIGSSQKVLFHEYVPQGSRPFNPDDESLSLDDFRKERAYIQASLHCDELPGMLVTHHLLKLLDECASKNGILKPITVLPFANPIGLQQIVMGSHLGRFSMSTGVNFNRDWIDVTSAVAESVADRLTEDEDTNVAIIRSSILEETTKLKFNTVEKVLKRELFKRAAISSIVLDLHCDTDAIMHTYTHDRSWPEMQDLAVHLQSECNLLAPESGGNPFDEACSCPWATLMDKFEDRYPIKMACQSVTIELRGESDVSNVDCTHLSFFHGVWSQVYDDLAQRDALALFDFFADRGYVRPRSESLISPAITAFNVRSVLAEYPDKFSGLPLTGVDMIEGSRPGILAWKVRPGDRVHAGQLLGEIIDMEDVDAPRTPITARCAGIVYGMRRHKLSWPGETIIKIAGPAPLEWRKGNLLTL